jgi:tRNA threonylcarbamoyladenosine biosynthesis protein TsaE
MSRRKKRTVPLPDEEATRRAARELAAGLGPGSVIALVGPLGAGKTTFVKAVAGALGIDPDAVTSPTFIRHQIHHGRLTLHHLDLYRVADIAEFHRLALDEWLDTGGVTLIEWADHAAEALPPHTVTVELAYADEGRSRTLTITEAPPRASSGS